MYKIKNDVFRDEAKTSFRNYNIDKLIVTFSVEVHLS